MNIQRIDLTDRTRDDWLALRRQDITASDIPAVCGEGLYGSPASVWAEKLGLTPPQEMTEAMKRGLWGEAAVFEALKWERPTWQLRRAKAYFRDADAGIGCTPDGAAVDPDRPGVGIIQAKVIARPVFEAQWRTDSDHDSSPIVAPLAYQLQTITEMELSGADWAVLAVLVIDAWKWELHIIDVPRHPDAWRIIQAKVAHFRTAYLETRIEPAIDPEHDEQLLKALYPKDNGKSIDLRGDNEVPGLVVDLEEGRASEKAGKERAKAAKTAIAAKMGEHAIGLLADGRRLTFKTSETTGYYVAPRTQRTMKVVKGGKAA